MKEQFYNTIFEEQETQINISYSQSELEIYTSRKSIYLKLHNKLGEPHKTYYSKSKKITGGIWKIPFSDKKNLTSILSRPLLIGNIK